MTNVKKTRFEYGVHQAWDALNDAVHGQCREGLDLHGAQRFVREAILDGHGDTYSVIRRPVGDWEKDAPSDAKDREWGILRP